MLWVPVVAAALWIVLWRVRFSVLENAFGLVGLRLVVFAVALWKLEPGLVRPLGSGRRASRPAPGENWTRTPTTPSPSSARR